MKYEDLISSGDIFNLLNNKLNLNLKSKGNSIFFNCPFHIDKKPSFSFEPIKKIFKCFSCNNFNQGKAGNFFNF